MPTARIGQITTARTRNAKSSWRRIPEPFGSIAATPAADSLFLLGNTISTPDRRFDGEATAIAADHRSETVRARVARSSPPGIDVHQSVSRTTAVHLIFINFWRFTWP